MSTKVTNNVIEIHYDHQDGKVVITPPDNDIMALSVKQAIDACRAFRDQIDFKIQFDALIERLIKWTHQNASLIDHTYLTTRETGLLFLVVQKDAVFNDELEDILTDLDVEIANDDSYKLIQMNVLAIPNKDESITSSFFSKSAFKIDV